MSRIFWPFTEKEFQKTIQELRNLTNWMQFALSIEGCRLLSQTLEGVLTMMGQQLEHFRSVQTLEADTLQILDVVKGQKRVIDIRIELETRQRILDWISTSKHYQKHRLIQTSRAHNTGNWILQKDEFIQ